MSTLTPELPGGQRRRDTHGSTTAGAQDFPQANVTAMPELATPAGSEFGPDHLSFDIQEANIRADQLPDGQGTDDLQGSVAVGNQAGRGQLGIVTHSLVAPATEVPAGQSCTEAHICGAGRGPILDDRILVTAAAMVDDLEQAREAADNRLRSFTRNELDSDGGLRGPALPLVIWDERGKPARGREFEDARLLFQAAKNLRKLEHEADLGLKRRMRHHPLGPWVAARVGVGEKQTARLLAAIGDPYWNELHKRPRTVSELWAFCGYHVLPVGQTCIAAQGPCADGAKTGSDTSQMTNDIHGRVAGVAAARRRGQKANWSATAKMRTWIIASQCVRYTGEPNKNGKPTPLSPYRYVYEEGREKYADAVHAVPCVRCGPAGKPALAGSPLSDGHKHARAVRLASKAILRDLWVAARNIHETESE